MPSVVTKQKPEVISKPAPQVVTKEKKPKITTTPISEPIRPIAHYTFKTPEGQRESVQVITHYYPNQIVRPLATADKHIDPKLMRAASIAEERAHAHSRSLCWHYVKEALLASGVIDSRPKSELARDAANDLVTNYGFKKLSVRDPFFRPHRFGAGLWNEPERRARRDSNERWFCERFPLAHSIETSAHWRLRQAVSAAL